MIEKYISARVFHWLTVFIIIIIFLSKIQITFTERRGPNPTNIVEKSWAVVANGQNTSSLERAIRGVRIDQTIT